MTFPALAILQLSVPAAYLYGLFSLLRAGEVLKAIGAGAVVPVGIIYGYGRFLVGG